jgi:NAD(P)-dependent dehydrogenase (short-subunit alcohol dehydrogenase family)
MNQFSLQGRNIIITGASSGIGYQSAITCSMLGANVFLLARNEEKLIELKERITCSVCEYHVVDLRVYERYEPIVRDIVLKHGKISGLIHSAGIDATIPLSALKSENVNEVFNTNTFAFFEMVKILSKNKHHCENSSFVAVSSVMSFLGQKGKLAYCASKAALTNGIKVLALELAHKKIRVNAISPAIIKTPLVEQLFLKLADENIREIEKLHPLGFGDPSDVANACAFLLCDASRWVTGSNLIVDGGYSAQ